MDWLEYENKNIGLKKQLGIYARDHFPKLYKIYLMAKVF